MRTLAIGDIHGCSKALDTLLEEVKLQPEDLLVTLGDYVDRGPDSRGVIERLIELSATCQLIALRGNHDLMMLEARAGTDMGSWLHVCGESTLKSYGGEADNASLAKVPPHHWNFLERTRNYHETESHFFVHATVYPSLPLEKQPSEKLHWDKLYEEPRPHISGKTMICGHTAQRSGKPLNFGHAICIDTWAYGHGWLTCLDVDNRLYWQANQRGESRMANLDRFGRR